VRHDSQGDGQLAEWLLNRDCHLRSNSFFRKADRQEPENMTIRYSPSWLLTFAIALLSTVVTESNAGAVLLAYDGFDYANGPLAGQGGTTDFGFAGAWYTPSGASGVVATGIERLPLESQGGSAGMSGAATTINFRDLATTFDASQGETWISLLAQRTDDTALTNFAGLSFYNGGTATANTEFALSTTVLSGINPQEWRLVDLANGGSSTFTATTVDIVNNRTDLLLAQIIWDGDGPETVNMWVNPSLSVGELGTPVTRLIAIEGFDRLRLASQNGAPFAFDEIRIGESLADVTPVIPPNPDIDGGGVGFSDFNLIRNNFLTASTHAMGDVNFDGFVDHADYFLWRQAFVSSGGSLADISWNAVPEPNTMLLFGGCAIGAVVLRARWRSI
jgi:hypothetical protein